MNNLFSVIVANYNNGRFLTKLVDYMLGQTYHNWELIIADDASTDDSLKIIEGLLKRDERIKLVKHTTNKGAGATFKSAMDASSGNIIGMLGADDALTPEALTVMMDAHLKNPAASIITSKAFDCDAELQPIGLCTISGAQPNGISFIHEIYVCNFVTFKRTAYNLTSGFDPYFQRAVDHDIYLKLEEVGAIGFVDQPVYLYRRHEGGISQGANGKKAATFSLVAHMNAYERRLKNNFTPNLTPEEYKTKALTYFQRMSLQYRLQKKYLQSLKTTLHCVKMSNSYFVHKQFWFSVLHNLKGIFTSKFQTN